MIRLILIFFTFFTLDNLLVLFLPLQPLIGMYHVIPNAFLTCLCLFVFFDKGRKSYVLAVVFGLLYDVYYAGTLGLYLCLFPIIVFGLRRIFTHSTPINFFSMAALMTGVIFFEEWIVYFMVLTVTPVNMSFIHFFQYILIPTLIFNALFMIAAYPVLISNFKKLE